MNKHDCNSNNNSSGGIGLLGVLQIIFIVLKCLDLIDWTWVQVFIPTFIFGGLLAIGVVVLFIILWRDSK